MKNLLLILFVLIVGCDTAPSHADNMQYVGTSLDKQMQSDPVTVDKRTADSCDNNNDGIYTYTFIITNVSGATISGGVFSVGSTGLNELMTPSQVLLPTLLPNQSTSVSVKLNSALPTSQSKMSWKVEVNGVVVQQKAFFYNC
ncbi:hypothetical protein E6Q11_03935 [Candidatus Dojkabacteria bacterium]|uniref:DUF11 domain-containing protein n=1 Tax=Candidatus Dojkabacteria bacterium TaxID=2099670 RepID=A0A5C7J5V1_9BACT|nr:MAG: hypothetical protein E6Q11_03935 [Candidatus Dojkabacteria bacterium]